MTNSGAHIQIAVDYLFSSLDVLKKAMEQLHPPFFIKSSDVIENHQYLMGPLFIIIPEFACLIVQLFVIDHHQSHQ